MPDRITKKLLVTANASSAGLIIYFSSQVPSPWMSRGVSIAWVVWISTGAVLVWVYDAFLRRLGPALVLAPISLYSTLLGLLTARQQEIVDPAVLIPASITLALFSLYGHEREAIRDPFALRP